VDRPKNGKFCSAKKPMIAAKPKGVVSPLPTIFAIIGCSLQEIRVYEAMHHIFFSRNGCQWGDFS